MAVTSWSSSPVRPAVSALRATSFYRPNVAYNLHSPQRPHEGGDTAHADTFTEMQEWIFSLWRSARGAAPMLVRDTVRAPPTPSLVFFVRAQWCDPAPSVTLQRSGMNRDSEDVQRVARIQATLFSQPAAASGEIFPLLHARAAAREEAEKPGRERRTDGVRVRKPRSPVAYARAFLSCGARISVVPPGHRQDDGGVSPTCRRQSHG